MIDELFARNKTWSKDRTTERADYFARLSNLQQPEYLWIGCADSRVPANVITGLEPVRFSCTAMSPTLSILPI